MAIVRVSQTGPGRAAEGKSDFNFSYSVPFQVLVDDPRDGPGTVGNAVDPVTGVAIPPRFSQYKGYEANFFDLNALCTRCVPKQDGEEWRKWSVEAIFETNFQIQHQQNPTEDPVVPWIEIESERRKVTKTWDGKDIVNSAGQLIDGIEDDFDLCTYCFLRNESQPTTLWTTYNNTVNSDTFLGCLAKTLRLKIHVDKPQRRNEYYYWPHTYRFKYDPNGWAIDPADRGTAVKRSDGTLGRPISPNTNEPIDGEVFLDGSGGLLSAGAAIVYLSKFTGSKTDIKQPKPFKSLNLVGTTNGLAT
jgi:hypothetical protein